MPLVVLSAGFRTSVQDCGRFRSRKYGVAAAGALDSAALRILNLLVGNDECSAGLEISAGRVRLRFTDDRLMVWSGGDFEVGIEGNAIPSLHCARVSTGAICEISPKRGRAWLAIFGGIDVPQLLGSRATDLRAGFGGWKGRALRDGDELLLGVPSERSMRILRQMNGAIADWSGPLLSSSLVPPSSLQIIHGKNWSDEIGEKLLAATFRVAVNSDRMGLRLEGANIDSHSGGELVSEAVTPGTIQLPPGGAPILLLADCQTVGGYPKIAHVITVDLARAAQLQPMDEVRFELTTLEQARGRLQKRERDIARFRAGLDARFG
jgi:antagonist of KipI